MSAPENGPDIRGSNLELYLKTMQEVLSVLDESLELGGRAQQYDRDTALLGAVPELDSMAVIGVLQLLEERFGFILEDDEIDGATFATVGTLVDFVADKLAAGGATA